MKSGTRTAERTTRGNAQAGPECRWPATVIIYLTTPTLVVVERRSFLGYEIIPGQVCIGCGRDLVPLFTQEYWIGVSSDRLLVALKCPCGASNPNVLLRPVRSSSALLRPLRSWLPLARYIGHRRGLCVQERADRGLELVGINFDGFGHESIVRPRHYLVLRFERRAGGSDPNARQDICGL